MTSTPVVHSFAPRHPFTRPVRLVGHLALVLLLSQVLFPFVPTAHAQVSATMIDGGTEIEPNGDASTATPLASNAIRITGSIFLNSDVDFYAFSANAGDHVYAATMTSFSSNGNVDSTLSLLASDGTTVLESDDNDGSFGASSSSIAGTTIPADGVYYLRVAAQSTIQIRPYDLYLRVQQGAPTAESEPNNTFPGQALPASSWVSGDTSSTTDNDFYTIALNAGDTVYLSLDLDPERDTTEWNGQLGLGAFGNPANILVVNDAGTSTPDSEAFFFTVKDAGTYSIFVGVPSGGSTFGTYQLSVGVMPAAPSTNCTTYTSADPAQTIPTGPGSITSTVAVPDNMRIDSIKVAINLTHNLMADLDVDLTAPGGNAVGLFSDIGSTTAGSQVNMNIVLDDAAAIPINSFTIVNGSIVRPELNYRLDWFHGQQAQGNWTLTIRDDNTNNGGTLTSWGVIICAKPADPSETALYQSDFESNDGGFTHSGTLDEWERGTPTFAPITDCSSGTQCWKTDLDNTYNAAPTNSSGDQDLLSPAIDLTDITGTLTLRWAMKYQIESASFDHASVEVREVGNPTNSTTLWQWLGATMTNPVGNPIVTVQESAGWGEYSGDMSRFAGKIVEVRFHLDSDDSIQLAGLAVDDVRVMLVDQPLVGLNMTNSSPTLLGDTTVFTATLASGTSPITYTWDFGDLTSVVTTTDTISHSYAAVGNYTATVTATNKLNSVTTTSPVTITSPVQISSAAPSVVVDEGQTAANSGSFSDLTSRPVTVTASIGTITQTSDAWNWSFLTRDGPTQNQTVTVTGTNELGATDTTTFTLTVNNIAPSFDLGANTTLTDGVFSLGPISFSDPGSDSWIATVNYGDGSGAQSLVINQSNKSFSLNHTYTSRGTFTVTVTVNDGTTTTTDSMTVTINTPSERKTYLPVIIK